RRSGRRLSACWNVSIDINRGVNKRVVCSRTVDKRAAHRAVRGTRNPAGLEVGSRRVAMMGSHLARCRTVPVPRRLAHGTAAYALETTSKEKGHETYQDGCAWLRSGVCVLRVCRCV